MIFPNPFDSTTFFKDMFMYLKIIHYNLREKNVFKYKLPPNALNMFQPLTYTHQLPTYMH